MTDSAQFETAPKDNDDVTPGEVASLREQLSKASFRPEVGEPGDSSTDALAGIAGGAALSEMIKSVPFASEGDDITVVPVRFDEPEGGYDNGATAQPPEASVWNKPRGDVDSTGYGNGRDEYPGGRSR